MLTEAKLLRPDAYHAPAIQQNDADCDNVEHELCRQSVALLDQPERAYTRTLRCNADKI